MNVDLVDLLTHPAFMLLMILGRDLIFGDPVYRFHPVRMIGSLISWYEAWLRHSGLNGKFGGFLLSLLLILITLLFSTCLLYTSPSPRDGLLSRMPSSA